jgi:hypothetical protein
MAMTTWMAPSVTAASFFLMSAAINSRAPLADAASRVALVRAAPFFAIAPPSDRSVWVTGLLTTIHEE